MVGFLPGFLPDLMNGFLPELVFGFLMDFEKQETLIFLAKFFAIIVDAIHSIVC